MPSRRSRIQDLAGRLRRHRRGVAALEFALVAPLFLALTIGFFDVVRLVRVKSLLTDAVSNMAEMVAAESGVPAVMQTSLQDYCQGVRLTMNAFATTTLSMAVASVTYASGSSSAAMDWEYDGACPTAATALGAAGAKTLASAMVPNSGDSVIVIKASYTYAPIINAALGSIVLNQTVFARPRYGVVKYCATTPMC